ncbi:hypothetical protein MANES_07G035900v8, partial [Manihot esculenta]
GLVLLNFAPHTGLLPMLLITVGIAGRGPILKQFLAKHVTNTQEQNANNVVDKDQVVARTNVWWSVVWFLGAVTSVSLLVFRPSYTIAFANSTVIMGFAYVFFWCDFFCYDLHHEPTECLFSIVFRVFKVAVLKRFRSYPTNGCVHFEKDSNEVLLLPHNPIFRAFSCLDKAAIPETPFPDQERQQGKLCTIEEVNRVKKLLGLLPMWTTLLIYALVEATGSTFFIGQVYDSSNAIKFFGFTLPIHAFSALESLVSSTVPYLFNVLIPKQWNKNKEKRQLIALLRIGLAMMCSILCCVTASKVEVHRLNSIHNLTSMSKFWLFPQFILLGIMEGLVRDGLCGFFYSQVDESMKHYESSLNDCVLGIGKFLSVICVVTFKGYFGDSVDKSRLDKYYLTLAALSCGNLLFYVLVACIYSWKESTPQTVMDIEAGDAELAIVLTSTSSEKTNKMRYNLYKRCGSLEGDCDDMANKKLPQRSSTFPP